MKRILTGILVLLTVAAVALAWPLNAHHSVVARKRANAFKMTWAIPDTNAVTIPTYNIAGYTGTINWGDGTPTAAFTS